VTEMRNPPGAVEDGRPVTPATTIGELLEPRPTALERSRWYELARYLTRAGVPQSLRVRELGGVAQGPLPGIGPKRLIEIAGLLNAAAGNAGEPGRGSAC